LGCAAATQQHAHHYGTENCGFDVTGELQHCRIINQWHLLPKKAYDGHQQGALAAAVGTMNEHHGTDHLRICKLLVMSLLFVF